MMFGGTGTKETLQWFSDTLAQFVRDLDKAQLSGKEATDE
jgi:hypothetical protein